MENSQTEMDLASANETLIGISKGLNFIADHLQAENKELRGRVVQLEAEAESQAAQTARLCRELADLARAAKDQSGIAYETGYDNGYEMGHEAAVATYTLALDEANEISYQRGWEDGLSYGESRDRR